MKNLRKYLLTAIAVTALSLSLASVSAFALCQTDPQDAYTCYPVGEDANYCYYQCYCKTGPAACEAALTAAGYESY
jgi:hypothetical protein